MAQKSHPRRQLILDAAERLLSHYGPTKTTMGDIARECGIGVGTVYLEFDSKDAIIRELAERRHGRVLDAMRKATAAHRTYCEQLRALLAARVTMLYELAQGGAHACDLVLCPTAAVQDAHGRFRDEELALLRQVLEDGATAGEFVVHDGARCADLIQRALATFSPPLLFAQSRSDALPLLAEMTDLLIQGLRPH